jgi:hypothetical protein
VGKTKYFVLSFIFVGLLAACAQSTIEIGMLETKLPGQWRATFETFTGIKSDTVTAQAGQVLRLDYRVKVDKGELGIKVGPGPDGYLWEVTLLQDAADTVEIPVGQDGRHELTVEGDGAGGSFDLSWGVD